jgi:excisionase family DNA binding protein
VTRVGARLTTRCRDVAPNSCVCNPTFGTPTTEKRKKSKDSAFNACTWGENSDAPRMATPSSGAGPRSPAGGSGPTFDNNERFLTVGAVATHFGVTQVTIKNWVDAGKLSAARTVGGHRRVAASSVVALLEKLGRPVPPTLTRAKPLVVIIGAESNAVRTIRRSLLPRARLECIVDEYAALLLCARSRPEVIVVDLATPGVDGKRLIGALARDPATRGAEVLAIAGPTADQRATGNGHRTPVELIRRGDIAQLTSALLARLDRAAKKRG